MSIKTLKNFFWRSSEFNVSSHEEDQVSEVLLQNIIKDNNLDKFYKKYDTFNENSKKRWFYNALKISLIKNNYNFFEKLIINKKLEDDVFVILLRYTISFDNLEAFNYIYNKYKEKLDFKNNLKEYVNAAYLLYGFNKMHNQSSRMKISKILIILFQLPLGSLLFKEKDELLYSILKKSLIKGKIKNL
jgi:hypothetical protein